MAKQWLPWNLIRVPLLLSAVLLFLFQFIEPSWSDDAIPGTLKGDFSVSLGGSAQYNIPIAVPEGTSAMSPTIMLSYDSNSGPGSLGLGWSIVGLSSITRTPKTRFVDGMMSPVTYTDADALVLDGSRLLPIGAVGPNRLLSKAVDDQTRIEEINSANGSYFISRTKAGLRLYYGAYAKDGPDGRIRTATGKILAWPCVRVEDTYGNYISFDYQSNGFGDWGLAHAKFTGNVKAGLAPYAELRISYLASNHPTTSYLSGEELRRSLIVDSIEVSVHGKTFRKYTIAYEETERLGSRRLRSITETGAYGAAHRATTFDYDEPNPHWEEQPKFQLPTEFGALASLEEGYRIIDLDSDGTPEIVYAVNFVDPASGGLRPFRSTYKLESGVWTLKPDLALPEPLVTSAGADTGTFFTDLDGDKLLEFMVASKIGSDPIASKTYFQESGKWVEKPGYAFPEPISIDGKRALILHPFAFATGERGLVAYDLMEADAAKRLKFWLYDGSKWIATPISSAQPIQATAVVDADLDCDGHPDLVFLNKNAGQIAVVSIAKNANAGFDATVTASTDIGEPIVVQPANVAGCDHLIVQTATTPKLLDVTGGHGASLDSQEIIASGISISDISRFLPAQIDGNAGDEIVLRLRATPNLDTAVLAYDPGTRKWNRLGSYDRSIQDESERLSPGYLPVAVDTDGDGNKDLLLLPTTQVLPSVALINNAPGWTLAKQFVPGIAFAQKDKLGVEPQFVDLNGDGLIDLVGHFKDEAGVITKAASINTANGWVDADAYITPEPLTNQKSGMTGMLVDVTADGIADFIYSFAGVHKFWKNTFELVNGKEIPRFWVEDPNFPPPPEDFSSDPYGDLGVRLVDVNGDGRVDMLVSRREVDGSLYSRAYVNMGDKWVETPSLRLPAPFVSRHPEDVGFETSNADYYRDLRGQFVDLNGDGLLDYVYRYQFTASDPGKPSKLDRGCQNKDTWGTDQNGKPVLIPHPISTKTICAGALINTGMGWHPAEDVFLPPVNFDADITAKTVSTTVIDINGDGLSDILVTQPGDGQTFLNTGHGWTPAPYFNVPGDVVSTNEKLNDHRFLDLNADGLVDVVFSRPGAKGAYLNTGYGWLKADALAPPIELVDSEGKDLGVRTVDVDGNGLPDILRSWRDKDGTLTRSAYLNLGSRADTLRAVTNGLGLKTEFAYRSLLRLRSGETTEDQFYTPSPTSEYPIISQVPTMYAVQKMTIVEGIDRKLETDYRYKGFRFDVTGGMPLGFESREAVNLQNKIRENVTFYQRYFLNGRPMRETTKFNNINLTTTDYSYDIVGPPTGDRFPVRVLLSKSVSTNVDLNGAPLGKVENTFGYDEFSDAIWTCAVYGDGSWSYTANQYDKAQQNLDPTIWYLGRLTRTDVSHATSRTGSRCIDLSRPGHSVPASEYVISSATFTYDKSSGVLQTETANASSPLSLTTTYVNDPFGNVIRTERRDNYYRNVRSSSVEYDPEGRFVLVERNVLDHRATRTVDDILNVVRTAIDPNGVETENDYDGFGRLRKSISPTGVATTSTVEWASGEEVEGQIVEFKTIEQVGNLPPKENWMDSQGRILRTITIGTEGRRVYQDTKYDVLGRATESTLPYFMGGDIFWVKIEYDELNRPTKTIRPDGATKTTDYDGMTVTETDALLKSTKKITNAKGLVIKTVDQAGKELAFEYDAVDRLVKIVQVDGQQLSYEYDQNGNKVATVDPDLGRWVYNFDAFGEVVWQRDARGQITTIEYDVLGRPVTRVTADKRTTWTYDQGGFAKGAVSHIEASDGYSDDYEYDRYGRVVQRETRIEDEHYTTSESYDEYNRVRVAYYPGGFAIQNRYDEWGFLSNIFSSDPDRKYGLWQERWAGLQRDQYGRVLRESYGNGLITYHTYDPRVGYESQILTEDSGGKKVADLNLKYDLTGNLTDKLETVSHAREGFAYDALYRLKSWKLNGRVGASYVYDDAGRILFKSDIGYYRYDPAKPSHAVSEISGREHDRAKWTYEYDPNGNMILGPKGRFEYYADNSVRQITASDAWSTFNYAPDGTRYLHYFHDDELLTRTVSTGAYERISEYLGAGNFGRPDFVRHRVYVSADTGVVAVLERTTFYDAYFREVSPPATNTPARDLIASLATRAHYLTKDQLGSITHVTDEKGLVVVAYTYDPWGERLSDPLGESHERSRDERLQEWPAEDFGGSFHRGFTGHEQLDHLDLVHMNGRIYDAAIAQFVSPDPTLQYKLMGQDYNRYAYVLNNPLRYIDPSGFGLFDVFKDIGNAITGAFKAVGQWFERNWKTVLVVIVAVVITYVSVGTLGPVAAGMLAGAFSGGLSAALYGGDVSEGFFKGAVIGGISAGLASGVGEMGLSAYGEAAAHGVAQGGLNAMQGGNFWQSFASGSVGSLTGSYMASSEYFQEAGDAARIGASAVMGGTSSVVGGGNFANGAVTGAFVAAMGSAGGGDEGPTLSQGTGGTAYVGGFFDNTTEGPAFQAYERAIAQGADAAYFTWDQGPALAAWIDENDGWVIVMGHSYGGDTAATVVAQGHYVESLVTVDPVSWFRPSYTAVAANAGTWTNLNAIGGQGSMPNFIAGVGGAWGTGPRGYATTYSEINADHASIMFRCGAPEACH